MTHQSLAAITHLTTGRAQIGTSLSFHLFFAVLGVGLPLMMLVAEGMHLRTGDPVWRALARRWSKVFGVLFAVGAVSGTIISFELGLLWPRFMAYAGGIIGLPFSLEGAAFFLEAICVGIYLYGWDRLSPRLHWLSGVPLAASALIVWIAVSPWVWGFAGARPAVANHVFLVLGFGPLAVMIAALRPAAVVTVGGGVWLALSPWILGYAGDHLAWLNELVTGALLSLLAANAAGLTGHVGLRLRPGVRVRLRRARRRPLRRTQASGS